jgi:hypothetical protein
MKNKLNKMKKKKNEGKKEEFDFMKLKSKGNSHQTEDTVYRVGNNLCQLFI